MRVLAAAAVLLVSVPAAAEREAEPQPHEVRIDLDIGVETQANAAFFEAQYTFTPSSINRTDEVVPILRRFVRHPSSLWVRAVRVGYTRESVTGGAAGGVLQLGPAYVGGDLGLEYDLVEYDPFEHAFWAMPVTAEAGFRPINLLSLGAFYTSRFVVGNSRASDFTEAERSGQDQKIGAKIGFATPNDRVFLNLSAWAHVVDWSFEEFHPGNVTIRGFGVAAKLAFQATSSFTFLLRGELHRDHWLNERELEDDPNFVGLELERNVLGATGGLEIVYWHKGRYGFRFGVGGGYQGAPPTVNNRETAILQIGLGLVTRF